MKKRSHYYLYEWSKVTEAQVVVVNNRSFLSLVNLDRIMEEARVGVSSTQIDP